jgi:hypothetical protein
MKRLVVACASMLLTILGLSPSGNAGAVAPVGPVPTPVSVNSSAPYPGRV